METIKGAGRIGPTRYMGYRVTWPFASLSIKREAITFSMWPIRYEFPRSAVLGLVTYRTWGFRSLRIVHKVSGRERWVLFSPSNYSEVENLAKANGWLIKPEGTELHLPAEVVYSGWGSRFTWVAVVAGIIAIVTGIMATVAAYHIVIGR
jgi:hypothetical protein